MFSLLLIIRVWYKKYRLGQRFHWKKYRKMTIQLLSILSIYLIFLFPPMILFCISSTDSDFYSATIYLSYFITILLPFVSTFSFPKIRIFRHIKHNLIHPQIEIINHLEGNRIH